MKIKALNILTLLLILLLGLFFIASSIRYKIENYNYVDSNDFSKDWLLNIDGTNTNKLINLPYFTKENPIENIIRIEKRIPNKLIENPHLKVGSSQQEVKIYLDNTLIYSFDSMRAINNGKTGGALWLLVDLPQDCFGKTLKIECISSYSKVAGSLTTVRIGSKAELLSELFFHSFPKAILSFSLFILCILFLIISIYSKKVYDINLNVFYIMIMLLLSSIWILAESQFFVFIFNNYSLIYFLQFISLFSFPIFLYKYIFLQYNMKNKKYILIFYKIHFYLLLILMLLQLIGLSPFFSSQWFFLFIFFITFSICMIIIIIESKHEKKLKKLINILIILFSSFILDTVLYDFKIYIFDINFLSLGIFLIELYILIGVLKNISNSKKIKTDNSFLNLQLDYQLKYYHSIKEKNLNLKSYKHDMLNHWNTVYSLINNNNIDDSKEYISTMINNFSNEKKAVIDTCNPVLDAILTEKIEIAKNKNISVDTNIFINKNLKIALLDFCIIFGNLLDNAIEASSKANNKNIVIKLVSKNNMLMCKISNSIDDNVHINKTFETTKKDKSSHGIGLKNVKTTIEKYNGELSINYDSSIFTVSFILLGV